MPSHTRGLVIGRVAGAPIILTSSSALMAVIIALVFAPVVSNRMPGISTGTSYLVAACFAVLLLVSILVHELAHGLVAKARGLQVQEFALTLIGGHTAFGGGVITAGTAALVAVVGPLANLLLALVFTLAAAAAPAGGVADLVCYAVAASNGFVGLFNLIPGLPLDGGQVLESVVWAVTKNRRTGTVVAAWAGRVVAVGFVIWVLAWQWRSSLSIDLFSVAWAALVGASLWSGASQALRGVHTARTVEGLAVAAIGIPAVGVAATSVLAEADAARSISGADAVVLLSPDNRPAAYVDPQAAAAVPGADRVRVPLGSVAVTLPAGAVIDADLRGQQLLSAVAAVSRFSPVMVAVRSGVVVALIRSADVAARLRS